MWVEQVEIGEKQDPFLSYISLETVPVEFVSKNVYIYHRTKTNNVLSS